MDAPLNLKDLARICAGATQTEWTAEAIRAELSSIGYDSNDIEFIGAFGPLVVARLIAMAEKANAPDFDWCPECHARESTPTSAAEGVQSIDTPELRKLTVDWAVADIKRDQAQINAAWVALITHIDTKMAEQRQAGRLDDLDKVDALFTRAEAAEARVRELEAANAELANNNRHLSRELGEYVNGPTFMGEPVIPERPAVEQKLRRLLAVQYAGAALYSDDGELQDASTHPFIDFKRDSVSLIERKMQERGRAAFDKLAKEHPEAMEAALRGEDFRPFLASRSLPTEAAGSVPDERAKFQAHFMAEGWEAHSFERYNIYDPADERGYKCRHVSDMWDGWNARALLAAQPVPSKEAVSDLDAAKRLRLIASKLGLSGAVPESDADLWGCAFSVLGMIRHELDKMLPAKEAPSAEPVGDEPAYDDPMDWPLPCDVRVGHGTIRKGCKLRTLVTRMKVLYDLAQKYAPKADPAALAELRQAANVPEPAASATEAKWEANAGPVPGDYPIDRAIKAMPLPVYPSPPAGGGLPMAVIAWLDAEKTRIDAVRSYNSAVKAKQEHEFPGADVSPQFKRMTDAGNTAHRLIFPMYEALTALKENSAALPKDQDGERWRAFERALRTGIPGAGHGTRIKVVEVCPMYGEEKEVANIRATIDAVRAANGSKAPPDDRGTAEVWLATSTQPYPKTMVADDPESLQGNQQHGKQQ